MFAVTVTVISTGNCKVYFFGGKDVVGTYAPSQVVLSGATMG